MVTSVRDGGCRSRCPGDNAKLYNELPTRRCEPWGPCMIKFLVLGIVLAGAMICSGCFSLSSTTTRTAPAPASAPPPPPPGMQRTVYPDGTYVDQPIQPVSR